MNSNLENLGVLAADVRKLLDAIRGGLIADMKTEQVQILQEFDTAYNAALTAFTQQKGEALNQFNQEKAEAFAAADSQLQSRRAAVDAVLADLQGHTFMLTQYIGGALVTKSSLGINADPNDETKSAWVKVPVPDGGVGRVNYAVAGKVTVAHIKRAYSVPGGYPDYATDKSVSKMQFIVANDAASSEQINAEIERLNLSMYSMGKWDHSARCAGIHTIDIDGLHDYKSLWVRFVNEAYIDGASPQNIEQFGGNAVFAIDRIVNYPNLTK